MEAQQRSESCFAELPHMRANGESVFCRSCENPRRLISTKSCALAKHVDELGQFTFGNRRNHLVANQINIFLRTFLGMHAIFRRDHVRSKKSWHHGARPQARGRANGVERLEFRFETEAVTPPERQKLLVSAQLCSPSARPQCWNEFLRLLRQSLRSSRQKSASQNPPAADA